MSSINRVSWSPPSGDDGAGLCPADRPDAGWAPNDGVDRTSRTPAWLEPGRPTDPQALVPDLLRWEGRCNHMYKDTRGYVTTGIGNLVKTADDAARLPWVDAKTGQPASDAQIRTAFQAVAGGPDGKKAGAYEKLTTLRLPDEVVTELATQRLEREFLPGLRRQFPGFDQFPPAARAALVDMAYNLGLGGLAKFEKLNTACLQGDWEAAAQECHRKSSRPERNDWTMHQFQLAARTA